MPATFYDITTSICGCFVTPDTRTPEKMKSRNCTSKITDIPLECNPPGKINYLALVMLVASVILIIGSQMDGMSTKYDFYLPMKYDMRVVPANIKGFRIPMTITGVGSIHDSFVDAMNSTVGDFGTAISKIMIGSSFDAISNMASFMTRLFMNRGDVNLVEYVIKFMLGDAIFIVHNLLWIMAVLRILPVICPLYWVLSRFIEREIDNLPWKIYDYENRKDDQGNPIPNLKATSTRRKLYVYNSLKKVCDHTVRCVNLAIWTILLFPTFGLVVTLFHHAYDINVPFWIINAFFLFISICGIYSIVYTVVHYNTTTESESEDDNKKWFMVFVKIIICSALLSAALAYSPLSRFMASYVHSFSGRSEYYMSFSELNVKMTIYFKHMTARGVTVFDTYQAVLVKWISFYVIKTITKKASEFPVKKGSEKERKRNESIWFLLEDIIKISCVVANVYPYMSDTLEFNGNNINKAIDASCIIMLLYFSMDVVSKTYGRIKFFTQRKDIEWKFIMRNILMCLLPTLPKLYEIYEMIYNINISNYGIAEVALGFLGLFMMYIVIRFLYQNYTRSTAFSVLIITAIICTKIFKMYVHESSMFPAVGHVNIEDGLLEYSTNLIELKTTPIFLLQTAINKLSLMKKTMDIPRLIIHVPYKIVVNNNYCNATYF